MPTETNNSNTPSEVPGLTTPQLKSGEVTNSRSHSINSSFVNKDVVDDADTSINSSKVVSVLDIASEIEQKLNDIISSVEKNDAEINERIDKIVTRVTKLEKKLTQSS